MVIVLDSSILIAVARGELSLDVISQRFSGMDIAITALTAAELLHGVYRAADKTQRDRRESFVESVIALYPILPYDLIAARVHGRLWAQLVASGIGVASHDLMIAASAISVDGAVVTRDRRSFPRIPGLISYVL